MVFEAGVDLHQPGMVVGGFVATDGFPVKCLGGRCTLRIMLEHVVVPAFRLVPAFVFEGVAREAKRELRGEFRLAQITFVAEAFDAALVEDQGGRCPEDVEAMELRAGFLDVGGDGDEVFSDERGELRVVI